MLLLVEKLVSVMLMVITSMNLKNLTENINKFLVLGGFILFDDSSGGHPGVTKLMNELKSNKLYCCNEKSELFIKKNKIDFNNKI